MVNQMNKYEDETHALIEAVEALCFALRAKQSALVLMMDDRKREQRDMMESLLANTMPIKRPGDGQ